MKAVVKFCVMLVLFFYSCSKPALETVPEVIPEKFMGTWYEIAALPTTYNKGCTCSKIDMELAPDKAYIRMISSCMKKGKQGAVLAKVYIREGSGNAKMRVQLFWPFRSDYYVMALAADYSYAMAGNPDGSVLQILSRSKTLDTKIYDELLLQAGQQGFDTGTLIKTVQDCNP